MLARVFGVIQMLWLASIGIGAALVPRAHLVARRRDRADRRRCVPSRCSSSLLGATVARIDAAAPRPTPDELRILASVPIFAPLPGGSLEHLAARLVPLRVEAGTVIVREGDAGDRFYIVAEGEVDVSQYGRRSPTLAAGGYFGEIALLRDVPRTATVTARTDCRPLRARPRGLPRRRHGPSAERGGGGEGRERRASPARVPLDSDVIRS